MPINFEYICHETGKAMKLQEIDDEICKRLGYKPHPNRYSSQFEGLKYIGLAILLNSDSDETTPEAVESYLANTEVDLSFDEREFIREFFGDFRYRAWRGVR